MTITEIRNLIKATGKPLVVQFTSDIADWGDDNCPAPLMKAKLTVMLSEFGENQGRVEYKLIFNMAEFAHHNQSVAASNGSENHIYTTYYTDYGDDVTIFQMIDEDTVSSDWEEELVNVKQCPPRQDPLDAQLADLITIADKFGFCGAAEYIQNLLKSKTE